MIPFSTQRAVLTGFFAIVLTAVVGGIWTALLTANLTVSPAIPWSVAVMALVLWLMWLYLGGRWKPRSTANERRVLRRATPVSGRVFVWALVAGLLSIVALAGLWIVLFQLANLPARTLPDFSTFSRLSVALLLIMASLVSSLPEEAGFRGYFQGMLELRLSGPAAIVVVALVMAPEHALTQGFVWPTLTFYLAVDVMLGTIAYLTKSIVPGIVVHFIGLLLFFTLVWPGDKVRQWIGTGSADTWFWIHVAQVLLFATLAVLAFGRLARNTNAERRPESKAPARVAPSQ